MKFDSRNFGVSAAHLVDPVPLLPSGPGGVRGTSLHGARSSTSRQSRGRLQEKFNIALGARRGIGEEKQILRFARSDKFLIGKLSRRWPI
jgi:hypothetical protein